MGTRGVRGPSSLLYHIHPPTREVGAPAAGAQVGERYRPSLRHRHFLTARLKQAAAPRSTACRSCSTSDIAMLYVEPDENDAHFYRNSTGGRVVYVVEGKGVLETVFGDLPYQPGDYLVIHRGHHAPLAARPCRAAPSCSFSKAAGTSAGPSATGTSSVKWWRARRTPSATSGGLRSSGPTTRRATSRYSSSSTTRSTSSCSITIPSTSWAGTATTIPGRSTSTTSSRSSGASTNRRRCTRRSRATVSSSARFCPRPYDFDPNAVPAPYNHSNVDSDEVLFYASSEFMSRKGIEYGVDHASSRRHAARTASGPHRGEHRCQVHQRARGDDGHLPPAARRQGGTGRRGREVFPVVDRGRRGIQPADVVRRET